MAGSSRPRRTYVVGFSDGGRLAERAGVELSDQIAAIGDVGGSLFQGGVPPIPHARAPVSVLILHGDADCDNLDIPTAVADKSGESCSAGSAVKLYRLFGGGHAWYGSVLNVPGQTPFNPDLGAATGTTVNEIVWNFFALHPKF